VDRLCRKCGLSKNLADFSINRGRRTAVCKKCESDRVTAYQKEHQEQTLAAKAKWREVNKEKEHLETLATRLAVKYLKAACPEIYRECIDKARAEVGLKPSRKSTGKLDNLDHMQSEHQPLSAVHRDLQTDGY
jgi:hypothetical protein